MSPVSEAKKRATAKYDKKAYDQITVKLKKGTKDLILATGETVNSFINQAVADRLKEINKE